MKGLYERRDLYTRHRRQYALGLLSLLATNGLALTIPWLFKGAIDSLADRGGDPAPLLRYGAAIAAVGILQAAARVQSRRLILGNSRRVDYHLKGQILKHLQRLAPSWFGGTFTGDLMSRAAHDVMLVRALGGPGVLYLSNSVFIYLIALPMMAAIEPRLTAAVFLPFPIMAWLVRGKVHELKRCSLRAQETLGAVNTVVQETLNGVAVVKSFGMETRQAERFRALSGDLMARNLDLARAMARMIPIITMAGGIGALVILYYGGRMVIEGVISCGAFVAFFAYLWMLLRPTVALGWILSLIQRSKAGFERLDAVLSAPVSISDAPDPVPVPVPRLPADIEIRSLDYRYDPSAGIPPAAEGLAPGSAAPGNGAPLALRGLRLTVRAGEFVGIIGEVGSGKSTLLRALPRLIEVPAGTVFVGGTDLLRLPLAEIRRAIGYVPQDDFLFSASIAENIAYGRPDAPAEEIEAAARAAAVHDDIVAFPEGYDSVVGERGLTLSGGQRQRIALARALLIDPPILLLDNALAHVDTETEEEILRHLRERRGGRTILLATNRLAGLALADRIVLLDRGRVRATGTHRHLLDKSTLYRDMVDRQALVRELDAL